MARGMKPRPAADRFWEKVAFAQPGGCWIWTAGVNTSGYGWFAVRQGRSVRAHRWSYERAFGPLPDDRCVLHKRECTSRRCVNPAHLYVGDRKQNGSDRMATQTHCKYGHLLSGENLDAHYLPRRVCLACRALRHR